MSRNRWYNDRINEPWHNQIGGGFAVPNQNFQQNQGQANQGKTGGQTNPGKTAIKPSSGYIRVLLSSNNTGASPSAAVKK